MAGIDNTAYITAIRFVRRDSYWDFSVEEHENYWMEGIFHHNTTEICCHKLSRFVFQKQPPPRKDTPFWIIANTYEQVCKAVWKEKLFGHGHIPKSEIQWDAIRWYRQNQGWPYEVPLKPWPGRPGRNWVLCFKSYKQGRAQMQAESIGGFMFVEQFPWNLLTEVTRGCREYNFPGSKFCEFTPIDPALSIEIEEMIENGYAPEKAAKASKDRRYLPRTWEIYRANTQCAMEAGHVDQAWFEEFFGMVSDEMTDTRLIGAFASYKGQIYQGYSSRVHLGGDEAFEFPSGARYFRVFDFGAGPQNAFVCLWAYRTGPGNWFVFDEYYVTQDRTIEEHAENILSRDAAYQIEDPVSYGDPSGAQWMNEFAGHGIPISSAINDVLPGIESVRVALKKSKATGEPGLIIHRDNCPNLTRQMRTYRWEDSSGTGINPRDARLQPLKKDDHAVDALRYLVHTERIRSGAAPTVTQKDVDHKRFGINTEFNGRGYLLNGYR